jgi:hypothetical protein
MSDNKPPCRQECQIVRTLRIKMAALLMTGALLPAVATKCSTDQTALSGLGAGGYTANSQQATPTSAQGFSLSGVHIIP